MLRSLFRHWRQRRREPFQRASPAAPLELLRQGRVEQAEELLRETCATQPDDAESWHLLGHVLTLRGNARAAVDALERAVGLAPENVEALYNLAMAHAAAGDHRPAVDVLERVTSMRPHWFAPWLTLGNLYAERDLVDEAEDVYRRALTLVSDTADVHYNLGNLLLRCGLADEAIVHYREAVTLRPSFVRAYSNLLCALNYSGRESPARIRHAHFEFGIRYADALAGARQEDRQSRMHDRIRIGYVSPDFRNHSVGRFIEPALKYHDRDKFAVYCYSDVKKPDARTSHFREYATRWRDITSEDDETVAEVIRSDEIDILVDLTGHTDDHRLLVFARKPAPVQVTWIGYPNTTGMSAIDYRITDAHADPPGLTEHLHSERLLRLPQTFLACEPPQEHIPASPSPCVSRGHVLFGSFNNFMKVSGRLVELWARVLRALPGSRLLMIGVPEGRTRARLHDAFAQHGVGPERLDVRGRLAHVDFLQAHADIDIALDTYPYHGTATTALALWMGIPVITLAGPTHVSRVGVSMLANVGLNDLAAATEEEYVRRTVELASDVPRLQELRATLRERTQASVIMDGARFTRDLESAYERIWRTVSGTA